MSDGTSQATTVLLLTARDAARALSISPRKLWQLTKDGTIPVVRLGRAVRYDAQDLRRLIDEHKNERDVDIVSLS